MLMWVPAPSNTPGTAAPPSTKPRRRKPSILNLEPSSRKHKTENRTPEPEKRNRCNNWAEVERVKGAGACFEWGRLGSTLCVSRAFGDIEVKQKAKIKGLSAEPEVKRMRISASDEFLLLASGRQP